MDMALAEAQRSLESGLMPVGVVIIYRNSVIARGHKTGKLNKRFDHAELMALRIALEKHGDAQDMTLYTTLEPCVMCFAAAANAKLARIVYGLEDAYGGIGRMASCWRMNGYNRYLPEIRGAVGRDQVRALFRTFFSLTTDEFWRDRSNLLVRACMGDE